MLFQNKKDGSLRLCVDYRGPNKSTINNKYLLPIFDETIDQVSRAKKLSNFDLKTRYNEIRIKECDISKRPFVVILFIMNTW